MNKKVWVAAVLAGVVGGPVLAAAPHAGFSLGANLGYAHVNGKLGRTFTAFTANDSSDLGSGAPLAGLFLGYGWVASSPGLYVGGEIFGQYQNLNSKREDNYNPLGFQYTTQVRTTNTFGAVAKLGYLCKDALFFLKLGVASAKWKFEFKDLTPPFTTATTNSRKTGFVAGLGMDFAVARNWAVGGEYTYTTYGSLKLPLTGLGSLTYKPKVSTFNLRLKYTF
jgi:opacity protein-like surface antigen